MKTFDKIINSVRNTNLHTTIVESDATKVKLALFIHGFKADRSEGGRFITVAESLAQHGFNSIMVSFPGCGDSEEPFENYCISNCINDMETIYQYMLNTYDVDRDHICMVGYSMGGRLTCLFSGLHPEIKTIGLWAAASYNAFNGGDEFLDNSVSKMVNEANENGYAKALNSFDNTYLHLSKRFFDDMFRYHPYDCVTNYNGNVIVVHGNQDITVPVEVSENTYAHLTTNKNKKLVIVDGANHGFGLWDDHMEQSKILTDETTAFILENL